MSEKINAHSIGDCVEVSTWEGCTEDGFFHPCQYIGLVLERELVDMDDPDGNEDGKEWLYRISLPDGRVVEAWDYEVKNVNAA